MLCFFRFQCCIFKFRIKTYLKYKRISEKERRNCWIGKKISTHHRKQKTDAIMWREKEACWVKFIAEFNIARLLVPWVIYNISTNIWKICVSKISTIDIYVVRIHISFHFCKLSSHITSNNGRRKKPDASPWCWAESQRNYTTVLMASLQFFIVMQTLVNVIKKYYNIK